MLKQLLIIYEGFVCCAWISGVTGDDAVQWFWNMYAV